MRCRQLAAYLLIVLVMLLAMVPTGRAASGLAITVRTSKSDYHYRQLVEVFGNVTYQGALVPNGLVAVQTTFPHSTQGHNATRTVPANATPVTDWVIEITSFTTTDADGNPQSTFSKGGNAWFEVNITNDGYLSQTILYTLTLCDSDATPFKFHRASVTILAGGFYYERWRLDLNAYDGGDWVSTGTARAYANVYTTWPSMGGSPYCPEKSAAFNITSAGTTMRAPDTPTTSSYYSYHAAFRLPPNVPFGIYTVTVSAYYQGFRDTYTTVTFDREYELQGDIIFNRKVDIFDIVAVASAYGTKGGLPFWNPEADLDANGKVDIFDVVRVSNNYGIQY